MRFELKGRGVMTFMRSYYLAACDGGDRVTHVLGGEEGNLRMSSYSLKCRGQSNQNMRNSHDD